MFARLLSRLGLRLGTSRPVAPATSSPSLVIERVSDPAPAPGPRLHRDPLIRGIRPVVFPKVRDPLVDGFEPLPAFDPKPLPEFAVRCLHLIRILNEMGTVPSGTADWFQLYPPQVHEVRFWHLFELVACEALVKIELDRLDSDDLELSEESDSITLLFSDFRTKEGDRS